MTQSSLHQFFDVALWLAGAGHFVILFASFQVPHRLNWKTDLPNYPVQSEISLVQSGFTVLTIIAFGALTLAMHSEMLRGDRAALGIACFIGTYWTARVIVDALYFSHSDWPQGKYFVLGHILLTSLFCALAVTYVGLITWHVWPHH